MNFVKLIDRTDEENENFIESVVGRFYLDNETNIVPFQNIFMEVKTKDTKFKEVLYCDNEINYNDLKKFVGLAKLHDSDDWVIPTSDELCDIVEGMDNGLGGVRISIGWTSDEANNEEVICVKFSEKHIFPSVWKTETLIEKKSYEYRWFIARR